MEIRSITAELSKISSESQKLNYLLLTKQTATGKAQAEVSKRLDKQVRRMTSALIEANRFDLAAKIFARTDKHVEGAKWILRKSKIYSARPAAYTLFSQSKSYNEGVAAFTKINDYQSAACLLAEAREYPKAVELALKHEMPPHRLIDKLKAEAHPWPVI